MAARNKGTHFVITANRLQDGATVYLGSDRSWGEHLDGALAIVDEAEQTALLAFAKSEERTVCDPYAFSVNVVDGRPVVLTQRETIRSQGPTVAYRRPDRVAPEAAASAKEA